MPGAATPFEVRQGDHRITTAAAELDLDVIHSFLTASYWSPGIDRDSVIRAIRHSLAFGLFDGDRQIGFARVVTDYTHFAYVADVFILEGHRGQGLGRWLVQMILAHPDLQGLRRWLLSTRDAHDLYRRCGFEALAEPERYLTRGGTPPWKRSDTVLAASSRATPRASPAG